MLHLDHSIIKRAKEANIAKIDITNIRDYAIDKHQTTDEKLYGGGAGMVMKPEPLFAAVDDLNKAENPRVIITSPIGKPYDQKIAKEFAQEEQLIIVCGHYEGIDQRFIDQYATDIISLGDFVLTGGEIAALAICDSVVRLLPGALGDERSTEEESFSDGLLEYPQYTRPPIYSGMNVPEVLQNGDHQKIATWRRQKSLELTFKNRPDLLAKAHLTKEDEEFLGSLRQKTAKPFRLHAALIHYPVYNKKKQIISTSLTNLDLHDIARTARTYDLANYFLIQPIESQRELINTFT